MKNPMQQLREQCSTPVVESPVFLPAVELAALRAEMELARSAAAGDLAALRSEELPPADSDLFPALLAVPVDAITREEMSSIIGMSLGRLLNFRDSGFDAEYLTPAQLTRWSALLRLVERARDAGAEAVLDELATDGSL